MRDCAAIEGSAATAVRRDRCLPKMTSWKSRDLLLQDTFRLKYASVPREPRMENARKLFHESCISNRVNNDETRQGGRELQTGKTGHLIQAIAMHSGCGRTETTKYGVAIQETR